MKMKIPGFTAEASFVVPRTSYRIGPPTPISPADRKAVVAQFCHNGCCCPPRYIPWRDPWTGACHCTYPES
jgi:hypothetical protein